MKLSSIYLLINRGITSCADRNLVRIVDIKMLASVGEKAAPIAVPLTCWNIRSANVK